MQNRYSRQEVLELIGQQGQQAISDGKATIIGCGALGSVSAELLARAGIGTLTLIDHDVVDITNLQRQALYTEQDLKKPKASCLKEHLERINSTITISAKDTNLNFENIEDLLSGHIIILDCTDNLDIRFLLNEFCVKNKLFWIHSAAIQEKGTIINFIPGGPCFNCIFRKASTEGSCEELGILNGASHITAAIQVTEAIKILLKKEPEKSMIRINAWEHTIDKIGLNQDLKCPVCKGTFNLLDGDIPDITIKECKTKKGWTVRPKHNIKLNLDNIKKNFKVTLDANILLVIDHEGEIIVHGYGELLFKELKDEKRIKEIADEIFRAGGAR